MVTFTDGPAAGVTLTLRRAPVLLRAVRSARGKWDALDCLDDEPRPGETIHVYQRVGEAGHIHVMRRPRSQSGWSAWANYREVPDQPADADVRTTDAWQAWCRAVQEREGAANA